jgi:3-phenylpropionate/trans-cinnamate dioxygenase ferredoxin reductase subunit
MPEKIVIIGAGQAGAQAVQSLRAEGFGGGITLIGEESWPPYQRPPLSKAYLLGQFERPRLFLKPDSF